MYQNYGKQLTCSGLIAEWDIVYVVGTDSYRDAAVGIVLARVNQHFNFRGLSKTLSLLILMILFAAVAAWKNKLLSNKKDSIMPSAFNEQMY